MSLVRVMAAGDSITMGSPAFLGGWRRGVANAANNLEFVGSQYEFSTTYTLGQHEGYSGGTVITMNQAGKALDLVDTYLPQIVFLMIGTNDITAGIEDANDTATLAEDFLAKASVDYVIVSKIPPRDSIDAKYAETVAYNAALDVSFAGASSGIVLIDACQDLTFADPDLMADSLHPNEAGYATMVPYFLAALQSLPVDLVQPVVSGDAPGSWA